MYLCPYRMWWRSGPCVKGVGFIWSPSSPVMTLWDSSQWRENAIKPWIGCGARLCRMPRMSPSSSRSAQTTDFSRTLESVTNSWIKYRKASVIIWRLREWPSRDFIFSQMMSCWRSSLRLRTPLLCNLISASALRTLPRCVDLQVPCWYCISVYTTTYPYVYTTHTQPQFLGICTTYLPPYLVCTQHNHHPCVHNQPHTLICVHNTTTFPPLSCVYTTQPPPLCVHNHIPLQHNHISWNFTILSCVYTTQPHTQTKWLFSLAPIWRRSGHQQDVLWGGRSGAVLWDYIPHW